jgi:hypothetical protein
VVPAEFRSRQISHKPVPGQSIDVGSSVTTRAFLDSFQIADYPFSFIGQWLSDGKQSPLEILFLGVICCYVHGSP